MISLYATHKRPVPGSNNLIRSQYSSPNSCQFHSVLAGVLTNQLFMMRGSRVMISFGFKVIFCFEKQFPVVLTWSHYSMDKCNLWIADEMDMTPLQVRYSWGKFLPQTQSGTPSTIIYTRRWSSWHEGLVKHVLLIMPMVLKWLFNVWIMLCMVLNTKACQESPDSWCMTMSKLFYEGLVLHAKWHQ